MKTYFILAFIAMISFANIYANDVLLQKHEDVIKHHGDLSFLHDKHYFVATIAENNIEEASMYINQKGFCLYTSSSMYIVCESSLNDDMLSISVKNVFETKTVKYTITINSKTDFSMKIICDYSNFDLDTKQLVSHVLPHSKNLSQIYKEEQQDQILSILESVQKISNDIFHAQKKVESFANKTIKSWKMTKSSSGNDSIYIDMGKSKILDYTVVITQRSEGVLVARIGVAVINDTLLKIYPVQISHYGKTYWLKGTATIIYQ